MLSPRSILGFVLVFSVATQLAGCAAGASAEASKAAGYPESPVPASAVEGEAAYDSDYASVSRDMATAAPPAEAPMAPPAPMAPMRSGGKKRSSPESNDAGYGYSADGAQQGPGSGNAASGDVGEPSNGAQPTSPSAAATSGEERRAPLLIYNAQLTLAVFEAAKAIDVIEKLAVDSGGYLVQRGDRHITIRVPAKAFRPALDKVETLGDELHREVNVSDVTEEFSDLQIRLQNARAVRLRLEELLRQATNVEDALAVQKELERVTEEIERTLGRLKLLSELVAFSTITVRFEARPTDVGGSRVTLPFPWLHELGLPSLLSM